jgi:hypothetical protein
MSRALLLVLLILPAACDAGTAAGNPDAGDDDDDCADPAAVLPADYVPIDMVSAGTVSSTGSGVISTVIDASAGGFGNSDTEPFVYLQFSGSTVSKVDISDVDAFDSQGWHLALKRYVVKANSGDSGPGSVRVASAAGADLAAVTTVPAAADFAEDDWATPACALNADPLGAPLTAVGVWYEAENMILTPLDLVFVLELPGGEHVKLEVATYYANPADATESGWFQLDWSPL